MAVHSTTALPSQSILLCSSTNTSSSCLMGRVAAVVHCTASFNCVAVQCYILPALLHTVNLCCCAVLHSLWTDIFIIEGVAGVTTLSNNCILVHCIVDHNVERHHLHQQEKTVETKYQTGKLDTFNWVSHYNYQCNQCYYQSGNLYRLCAFVIE